MINIIINSKIQLLEKNYSYIFYVPTFIWLHENQYYILTMDIFVF